MNNTHNLNLPDSSNLHFLHFNDLSFPTGCLSVSVSVSTSPGPSEREVNQNIRLFSEICGFWLGTDSRVTSRNQRLQYQRRFPQNVCYSASNCSLWYSAEKTGRQMQENQLDETEKYLETIVYKAWSVWILLIFVDICKAPPNAHFLTLKMKA